MTTHPRELPEDAYFILEGLKLLRRGIGDVQHLHCHVTYDRSVAATFKKHQSRDAGSHTKDIPVISCFNVKPEVLVQEDWTKDGRTFHLKHIWTAGQRPYHTATAFILCISHVWNVAVSWFIHNSWVFLAFVTMSLEGMGRLVLTWIRFWAVYDFWSIEFFLPVYLYFT